MKAVEGFSTAFYSVRGVELTLTLYLVEPVIW